VPPCRRHGRPPPCPRLATGDIPSHLFRAHGPNVTAVRSMPDRVSMRSDEAQAGHDLVRAPDSRAASAGFVGRGGLAEHLALADDHRVRARIGGISSGPPPRLSRASRSRLRARSSPARSSRPRPRPRREAHAQRAQDQGAARQADAAPAVRQSALAEEPNDAADEQIGPVRALLHQLVGPMIVRASFWLSMGTRV